MGKPKIRFKGYADDWEQRKVSELLYLSNEKNDGSYTRDDVLAASLGTELQKKHIYFGLRATDESVKNYKVVLPKDVIYTKSPIKGFPNGIIRTNKGETGIVPTLYCVYHSIDTINPSIIQAYFESKERLDAYLVPLVNIGARNNVNITDKEFINGSICIPKNETEQNRIVDLLEKISNLITLHQRKCDETKKLKKYMLQKMFPQNGEKVPKIRFAGFSDDWEQRKLGDLGTIQTCKRIFKDQTSESGEIPFYKNGTIGLKADAFISREIFEEYKLLYPYPEKGDILISAVGSVGRTAEYTGEDEYFQDSNVVWLKTDNSIDKKYLKVFYQVIKWLIEGSTVKHLYNDNILKSEIVFPYSLDEQRKIGEYFDSLDHLITLHQQKCDELQNIKKFMLKNMFA